MELNIETLNVLVKDPRFLEGVLFLVFILFGKIIIEEFQENVKVLCQNRIIKYAILYAMCYVATHDYVIALLLTVFVIFIFDGLCNVNSPICLIKHSKKTKKDEDHVIIPRNPVYTSIEDPPKKVSMEQERPTARDLMKEEPKQNSFNSFFN